MTAFIPKGNFEIRKCPGGEWDDDTVGWCPVEIICVTQDGDFVCVFEDDGTMGKFEAHEMRRASYQTEMEV